MAYEIPPLKLIAETLEEDDCIVEFVPGSSSRPVDLVLVSLGETADEPYILEISFPNDLLVAFGDLESIGDVMILQFLARYRFSWEDSCLAELNSFLLSINRIIPAGAFGISEDTGTIFLQYGLMLPSREIAASVLLHTVSTFDFFFPTAGPLIQAVGSGQRSAAEAVSDLEQSLGTPIPSMLPGPASLIEPVSN